MWLHLHFDELSFYFRISDYGRGEPSHAEVTLQSAPWLDYHISPLYFYAGELEYLRDRLADLLSGKLTEHEKISFIEPDLVFCLNPSETQGDTSNKITSEFDSAHLSVSSDIQFHFLCGVSTDHYISIYLNQENLEHFYIYLCLITKEISKKTDSVQERIEKGIFLNYYTNLNI